MKVWELMAQLSKYPAGARVSVEVFLSKEAASKSGDTGYLVGLACVTEDDDKDVVLSANRQDVRRGFEIEQS
jgi:hypothetical protein